MRTTSYLQARTNEFKWTLVKETLESFEGDKKKAAAHLGITVQQLYTLLGMASFED